MLLRVPAQGSKCGLNQGGRQADYAVGLPVTDAAEGAYKRGRGRHDQGRKQGDPAVQVAESVVFAVPFKKGQGQVNPRSEQTRSVGKVR